MHTRMLISASWLLVLCSSVSVVCRSVAAEELRAERPNFVFIMADDLGWADVQFHGGTVPTPHLNQLAAGGVELTQHYVAPLCTPTRTGLLSGRFWSRFGVTKPQNPRALPQQTMTLPRALKTVGYRTCLVGKWHLGSDPVDGPQKFDFDSSYGSLAGGVGPWNHRYKQGPFSETWHRDGQLIEETGHVTDLLCAEAVKWITTSPADVPFLLYVPLTAVHLPIREPAEWLAKVPAEIKGDVARHYAACIMHLDDTVGRIVKALEQTGRRDQTLLVFTSDNGGSTAENCDLKYPEDDYPEGPLTGSNQPLRGQKGQLFEGGIRVPTVVSWPGRLPPGKLAVPAHICDWMPTFCRLAEAVDGRELKWDGQDLWPMLTGQATRRTSPLYWVAPEFQSRAVRQGDWKLIEDNSGKSAVYLLFDLATDPYEQSDVAAGQPEQLQRMQQLLQEISRDDQRRGAGE